jgi:p-aminobenzoyl-glutamate transporter AbgT
MKSEDGWWILKSVVRPRLRSSKKGSLEERKDDTRTFTREKYQALGGWNLTLKTYLSALWKKNLPRI